MTKLVQANTIACSSSAMLEQHARLATRSSRLARQSRMCRVETSQVEFGTNTSWWQDSYNRRITINSSHRWQPIEATTITISTCGWQLSVKLLNGHVPLSICSLCSFAGAHRFLTCFLFNLSRWQELTSDNDEETVNLASATIIFSSWCAFVRFKEKRRHSVWV